MMKKKHKSYQKAIGDVTLGRIIVQAMKTQLQLGIRAQGFPESTATAAYERMLEDVAAVDKLLKFIDIENRILTQICRIGTFDIKVRLPGEYFFKQIPNLTKELILKSIRKLAKYEG